MQVIPSVLPWLVAAAFVASPLAVAARPAAGIAIADQQLKALAIRTQALPAAGEGSAVMSSFPAQVVLPDGAEQVVSAPVAGMVAELLVQRNQPVQAGTPLLRIVSPEYGQLQMQVLQAASRARLAQQTLQREQALFAEGIIPERRVQEAGAMQLEQQAALTQARQALRLAGMSQAAIARIVASGQPQDSVTLTAARAGVVSSLSVKPGQRVEAASPLLHVADGGRRWLDIQLPASGDVRWLTGSRVQVVGRNQVARIVSIGSQVNPGSQTQTVRAQLDSHPSPLQPGEIVSVQLPLPAGGQGWDVPLAAVTHQGKQAYVFVRRSGGFDARPVSVVGSAGQSLRIQGPLRAGEQIAVSGVVAIKGKWLEAGEAR